MFEEESLVEMYDSRPRILAMKIRTLPGELSEVYVHESCRKVVKLWSSESRMIRTSYGRP